MRTIDVIQSQSNRNESLRLLMLLIIAGTFPFYCFAIYFIGSAPPEGYTTEIPRTATPTPLGADLLAPSAATDAPPPFPTFTPLQLPIRTPAQFLPSTAVPAQTIVTAVSPTPLATDPPPTPTPRPTNAIDDEDFDGLADDQDRCPTQYGYADNEGCPYSDDADRDGIRDAIDACPNEFAPENPRGCRDFDDDGLDTSEDDCPNQAGPSANRGCPLPADPGG